MQLVEGLEALVPSISGLHPSCPGVVHVGRRHGLPLGAKQDRVEAEQRLGVSRHELSGDKRADALGLLVEVAHTLSFAINATRYKAAKTSGSRRSTEPSSR